MKYAICASAVLALCVAASSSLAAERHHMPIPSYIRAAVDSTSRPESDTKRDVNRKPAEVLAFAGIKPGMMIGELEPDGNYYTRLLCRVVGPSGHVYGVDFKFHRPPAPAGAPAARARRAPAAAPARAPLGCDNVTLTMQNESELTLPSGLDVVWTTDNYHDFHDPFFTGKPLGHPDMKAFDTTVYNALKPGGIFLINDHVAAAGTGMEDTNTLHRIDPALVKREVESVGFKLIGSSNVLHTPSDDHTKKVFVMVDHTDEFIFKFQKPTT